MYNLLNWNDGSNEGTDGGVLWHLIQSSLVQYGTLRLRIKNLNHFILIAVLCLSTRNCPVCYCKYQGVRSRSIAPSSALARAQPLPHPHGRHIFSSVEMDLRQCVYVRTGTIQE
jgi:hypothetical protein